MQELVDVATKRRAIAAARGRKPFDRLLVGGTLVDVGTGELREADIGLVGPIVASVHRPGSRSDAEQVADLSDLFLAPGFIDAHVHFEASMLTPAAFAEAVCPRGTTCVLNESLTLGNVAGTDGVRYVVDASRGIPVRFIVAAPASVPNIRGAERTGADMGASDIEQILAWPEVGALGEACNVLGVIDGDAEILDIVNAGVASGKMVSGHAMGLTGADLQAYQASGLASDHSSLSPAEAMEKIRSGMTLELCSLREYLFPELVPEIMRLPVFPPHLVTCTDDLLALTLVEEGGIDHLIRRLVACGMPPVYALRCATLHGAYRLQRPDLGLVAAGRRADIVALSDLENVAVEGVYFDGRHVAQAGEMIEPVVEPRSSPPTQTMRLGRLSPEDFTLRIPGASDGIQRLRVIVGPRPAHWGVVEAQVRGEVVQVPPGHLVQATVHRFGRAPGVPVLGLHAGWGDWTGAVAASPIYNLVVFGKDPVDMAIAANAVIAAGGGVSVARNGRLLEIIELPIAGEISPRPLHQVAEAQRRVLTAMREVGQFSPTFRYPILQIIVAALAILPGPHVTDVGLMDGTTGEVFSTIQA